MKKNDLTQAQKDIVEDFLKDFKKQSKLIRKEIASRIPVYNELLDLHAQSFEEFAKMPLAIEQGYNIKDVLFSYEKILPSCPKCDNKTNIFYSKKEKMYRCNCCKCRFTANKDSISSGTKQSALIWLKVLRCMLSFYTIEQTCKVCDIAPETFYNIRNRIFFGMDLMMRNVKLYGNIQCDNFFWHASYKGYQLERNEYSEDSVFFEPDFIPRKSRKRGGPSSQKDKNANSCCVFTAIDDRGHVLANFVGIGAPTANLLKNTVEIHRFETIVPEKDSFEFQRPNKKSPQTSINDASLLISDKENAIIKFAKNINFPIESHVFRRNGRQIKLPATAHNIQRVNNLHAQLDSFLRDTHFVSSKYLPGYLVFFEFIKNTAASEEAIRELFCILAKPGIGTFPDKYFKNLYQIPNKYVQLMVENEPLAHIELKKVQMYYDYAKYLDGYDSPEEQKTVKEIAEYYNCSPSTVRRNYNNLYSSGFDEMIRNLFKTNEGENIVNKKNRRCIKAVHLTIFDDYDKMRQLPAKERIKFDLFMKQENQKYEVQISPSTMKRIFKDIVEQGLRPPLSDFRSFKEDIPMYYEEYMEERKSYLIKGEPIPPAGDLIEKIAKKHGYSKKTMAGFIGHVNEIKKHLHI